MGIERRSASLRNLGPVLVEGVMLGASDVVLRERFDGGSGEVVGVFAVASGERLAA